MQSRIVGLFASALLLLSAATTARADTIAITGGGFISDSLLNHLTLLSDRFSVELGAGFPITTLTGQLLANNMAILTAHVDSSAFEGGGTVDGVSYPGAPFGCCASLLGAADLVFTTPAISLSAQDPGRLIIFGAPFAMTGSLQLAPRDGAPVVQSNIIGAGTLDLQARVETPGGAFAFESGTFRFASSQPSPTPEPATLFMMGAGLIAAGRRLRKP